MPSYYVFWGFKLPKAVSGFEADVWLTHRERKFSSPDLAARFCHMLMELEIPPDYIEYFAPATCHCDLRIQRLGFAHIALPGLSLPVLLPA